MLFLQELSFLTSITKELEEAFIPLEKCFQSLTGGQKKIKLSIDPSVTLDSPPSFGYDEKVEEFHKMADQYIDLFMKLQETVVIKQDQIEEKKVTTDDSIDCLAPDDMTPGVGSDVDLIAGLARPVWLDLLMQKYSRHMVSITDDNGEASGEPHGTTYPHCNPLNLGSFCAFLSCCLIGRVAIVADEHKALIEVILLMYAL